MHPGMAIACWLLYRVACKLICTLAWPVPVAYFAPVCKASRTCFSHGSWLVCRPCRHTLHTPTLAHTLSLIQLTCCLACAMALPTSCLHSHTFLPPLESPPPCRSPPPLLPPHQLPTVCVQNVRAITTNLTPLQPAHAATTPLTHAESDGQAISARVQEA